MPRKIIVEQDDGASPVLTESPAADEEQLQELVKENPDLIPIEEFGFAGPLMVVGRETTLPSGSVDLVGITRGGELLVIEFKTGPQNPDFRHALSQLLDYGSDLWGKTYEEFESTVAKRYFTSDRCKVAHLRGKTSLQEAVGTWWPDLSKEESATFRDRLSQRLADGTFEYVIVAQRFTDPVQRTMEYLNTAMKGARFYAVELVRFEAEGLLAYETRTILKPVKGPGTSREQYNEEKFLAGIQDEGYRLALEGLFKICYGLRLRFEWGSAGTSIRVATPSKGEPVSIAWLFPPGRIGWMGLTDLTLGYDVMSAERVLDRQHALDRYIESVSLLPDIEKVDKQGLVGYAIRPGVVVAHQQQIAEILSELVEEIQRESQA